MRLIDAIETTGSFWLTEDPDARLPGILRISESGEITVELTGVVGNPLVTPRSFGASVKSRGEDEDPDPGRIVGVLQKGERITLEGCFWQKANSSFPSNLATSIVHADIAFVGAEYENKEEPLFAEIILSVQGLDAWLAISAIEVEHDLENKEGFIRYCVPEDISLTLPHDIELAFRVGLTFPGFSLPRTEAGVRQTALVVVKLQEPRPVQYFLSLAIKLCNFLTLALDETVSIQSMTGYLEREKSSEQKRRASVKIYGQFAPWPEVTPTMRWSNALFRYSDVASQICSIMAKWFENYEMFEPAFDLYFASKAQSSQFVDVKILWLTQALETLHRRSSTETEMSEEEFVKLRESVLLSCPQDRQQWLNDRLRYANGLSFRRPVRKLLEPFEQWFGDQKERAALVNKVCDTRNYLAHYDETTTGNRATGSDELFDLYQKLDALFLLHLLSLAGIDYPSIESIVKGNGKLRRKLAV